jgi:hypothetical protein
MLVAKKSMASRYSSKKIISNISCGLLRKIPESYRSIFDIASFEPGYSLHQAYESFENRNPMPDSYIQSDP